MYWLAKAMASAAMAPARTMRGMDRDEGAGC